MSPANLGTTLALLALSMTAGAVKAAGGCGGVPVDDFCSVTPDDYPPPCCPPGYWLYCDPCTGEPLRCVPSSVQYPALAFECPIPVGCVIPNSEYLQPHPDCLGCDDEICLPSCWLYAEVEQVCIGPEGSRVYTFDLCAVDCNTFVPDWRVCSSGSNVPYTVLSPDPTGDTFCVQASGAGELTVIALGDDGSCETYSVEATVQVPAACPGDVDGSGTVDVGDLTAVTLAWGDCPIDGPCDGACCPEDCDGSGAVDVGDLTCVVLGWGPCQ